MWCPVPPRNRSDLSVRRRSTFACARKARRALPLWSGDQHSPTTREPSSPRRPIELHSCLILLTCHRLRLASSQRAERRRAAEFRSIAAVVTSGKHKVDAGIDRRPAEGWCAGGARGEAFADRSSTRSPPKPKPPGSSECLSASKREPRDVVGAPKAPCSATARDALARFRDSWGALGPPG